MPLKEVDQGAKLPNDIFLSALTDVFKVAAWALFEKVVVPYNVLTYLKNRAHMVC